MASSALIPKRSDVMTLVPGQSLHELTHSPPPVDLNEASSDIHSQIQKHNKQPRYIRRDSADLSPIRRSTSAQSVNSSYAKNRQHYHRCIEYLQDQHKQTLVKLHQEVQDLKQENKRLHFKILVEDEGGVAQVVKQTLSINTDKTNISNNLLLQETIKDLKVKLNLSEDSIQHQASTIKAQNKHLKMLKRVPHPPYEKRADLGPVKNEVIEKNRIITTLETERDMQRNRIEELQQVIRQLRVKPHGPKERHLAMGSAEGSIHSGSPRTETNFMVTNSASPSRHNLVNAIHGAAPIEAPPSTVLKNHSKLPPLSQANNALSSPTTGTRGSSLVPKNSRVDIAKRTRKLQKMRQNNVDLNEDHLF